MPGLIRDKDSHAVINTDKSAYQAFIASKKKKKAQDKKVDLLEKRLDKIETLLLALLEKTN